VRFIIGRERKALQERVNRTAPLDPKRRVTLLRERRLGLSQADRRLRCAPALILGRTLEKKQRNHQTGQTLYARGGTSTNPSQERQKEKEGKNVVYRRWKGN